jgi:hypothetical protein
MTYVLLSDIRNALFTSNRAFVFVRNIDKQFMVDQSTQTITKWRFIACWENGGNTPTKNMTNRINYLVSETPI